MKALLAISLNLFIALFPIYAVQADEHKVPNHPQSQLTSDLLDVNYISRSPTSTPDNGKDTIVLQTKVLEKINEALARGAITSQQASDLKEQLNNIGTSESWYKSLAVPVPAAVVKENTDKLAALNTEIDKQLPLNFDKGIGKSNGSYSEVSKLIGHAAANNKITNAQAEEYYSQLAQIENDTESLKNDPASSNTELTDLNKQLKLLKTDIQSKIK